MQVYYSLDLPLFQRKPQCSDNYLEIYDLCIIMYSYGMSIKIGLQ